MADEKERKKSDSFEETRPDMFDSGDKSRVEYARPGQKKPREYKTYWRKLMDSTQKKMSKGASQISRMFSWARGDNWRRGGEGNREHRKPGRSQKK